MSAPGHAAAARSTGEAPPVAPPGVGVVAIAASAGGVQALSRLLPSLPESFGAPVVALLHLDPHHRSLLVDILRRLCSLTVQSAEDGQAMVPGTVYVAPPDHHVLVNADGTISLTQSELVHFVRPSADLLFESVAAAFGPRGVAVVLTGTGEDGAMGVGAVKEKGGTVLVQDEATSDFFGMPGAALATGSVDRVLPLDAIGPALEALVAAEGAR